MKKIITTVIAIGFSIAMTMTVWAGTWKQDNNGWWYENDNGAYQNDGWFQDPADSQWYFASNSGYILQNTWMGNYYLGASGAMLTNTTTPDGYKVGPDGAWIQDEEDPYVGSYYYRAYLADYMGYHDDEVVKPNYNYIVDITKSNGTYYLEGIEEHEDESIPLVKKENFYLAQFEVSNTNYPDNMASAYVFADGNILVSISDYKQYMMRKIAD